MAEIEREVERESKDGSGPPMEVWIGWLSPSPTAGILRGREHACRLTIHDRENRREKKWLERDRELRDVEIEGEEEGTRDSDQRER